MNQTETSSKPLSKPSLFRLSAFASVKLTVILMVLIATSVLIGAWCPQESQVGRQKVVEQFGEQLANDFIKYGIADIFHTPWFLGLIGLLTVNMIACSVQRVFPKVKSLKQQLPFLGRNEIAKMASQKTVALSANAQTVFSSVDKNLNKRYYKTKIKDNKITAEFGKVGRLAATVTHIGLLTLLAGVTITSWTGFTGFQTIRLGESLSFAESEHSKLWIGQLPKWTIHVDGTKREDYDSGDPKQWYSQLSVIEENGKNVYKQEISVNNPLTYKGVDVYQSSWGLDQLIVTFSKRPVTLNLRPMGKLYAAFLPLNQNTILIFSIKDQFKPLRLFAKAPEWPAPRLLAEIPVGKGIKLGDVDVSYLRVIPVTGLQYKSDPGLIITYIAFGFIIAGIMLAAIPHRQLWVHVLALDDNKSVLAIGGISRKAKKTFEKSLDNIIVQLTKEFGQIDISQDIPSIDNYSHKEKSKKEEQYV